MKVLAYVHAYVPDHNGGAETTLHDMMRTLAESGHEAVVVLKQSPYLKPRTYVLEGVKVIQSADKKDIVLNLPGTDLMLTHLECSKRAAAVAAKFRIPLGHIIHNNLDLTKTYIAQGADFIVYNTEWIKEDFQKTFPNIPSLVVHPPILKDRYATQRGKKVTLVNLFERKGPKLVYELARRMLDVEFLAVKGGYGEQVLPPELPNIELMENDFEIKKVYEKTKVILMPSVYESYGRVACEALASGIPSIVAQTPGLKEALSDAGTYVDVCDVDAWEKALRSILSPRKYGAMSKLALARSEALDTMAQQELENFVMFCEMIVSRNKRAR